MSIRFRLLTGLVFLWLLVFAGNAAAVSFPLCSSNQTDQLTLSNTNGWIFYACYTTPETFKVKINSIKLVKLDNSTESFYAPSTPGYTDLTMGIADLAQNVTPVPGTYKALRLDIDAVWKIKASADYTPVGRSTKYCRTKELNYTFSNTSLTGNGLGSQLSGDSAAAVETTFKHNAFNFVTPGATGSENQYDQYSTYPYMSKMTYSIQANGIDYIEHYFVNSSGTLEHNSSSIVGSYMDVYFLAPIVIESETDLSYKLTFDISKAIGFAHDHETSGTIIDDNQCNYMTIGPMPITLTVESNL